MTWPDEDAWRDDAACIGYPPEAFFPAVEGTHKIGSSAYRVARELCDRCLVRRECLVDAMTVEDGHNRFGMRAGMSPGQRRMLAAHTPGLSPADQADAGLADATLKMRVQERPARTLAVVPEPVPALTLDLNFTFALPADREARWVA